VLLSISTSHRPATDLGYLLHKNPARVHSRRQTYGTAHVFYPEASPERCTAALMLEIDPVGLVRNRRGQSELLGQYVNDRPYAANSFLSSAIAEVFGSALNGRSSDRPDLVSVPIDLEVHLPALPVQGGEVFLRELFEPLAYVVTAKRLPFDDHFPEWGDSPYYDTKLLVTTTLQQLLTHLYVLIPVLDNEKHYWVGEDEVTKLLKHGEAWLGSHPARDAIVRRYLKHKRSLARLALDRLIEADGTEPEGDQPTAQETSRADSREQSLERNLSLNDQRLAAVASVLTDAGCTSVIDLGCGEGKLVKELLKLRHLAKVTGLDVSHRALDIAADRLQIERLSKPVQEKLSLLHGSLMYRDRRLSGYDAATVIEVIEHLDAGRLSAFERVLFEYARPRIVVMTTPNQEYNVLFERLPAGQFRHPDHRFEWSRAEFQAWAHKQAERYGYEVEHRHVGPLDVEIGAPTQMAIFRIAA
jgi:3' terminal RNA ribose 2'-O-methyltransferase Hen1